MSSQNDSLVELGAYLKKCAYKFITVTPATQDLVNARTGSQPAQDLRSIFGRGCLFSEDSMDRDLFQLMQRCGILEHDGDLRRSNVRWSSMGAELLVHSQHPTEQPDAVFLGPDTYRFVRAIKERVPHDTIIERAIDIGCGSGAAAIQLAMLHPSSEVLAVDINQKALDFTEVNARLAGVHNLVSRHSNLLAGVEGEFDLIVANPPYMIDPLKRSYRHGGGALGSDLSLSIIRQSLTNLRLGGQLLLYTGTAIIEGKDYFLDQLRPLLPQNRVTLSYEEMDPDVFGEELSLPEYSDVERIAVVLLSVKRHT